MFKFFVLLSLVAVASGAALSIERLNYLRWLNGRIWGGETTEIEDVPYQVNILQWNEHICGGSIISRNYVVTAAHCFNERNAEYRILAGTNRANRGGSNHTINSLVIHEKYVITYYIPKNDIAIIRVNEPFELDATRQPISLFEADEESSVGETALTSGWGSTEVELYPDILRKVIVPIISKESCNEQYENMGGLPFGQICAAYPDGGKDACKGDSGGPFTIKGRLAGVVSWGDGCGLPLRPGVYTEIASYRQWIREHSDV